MVPGTGLIQRKGAAARWRYSAQRWHQSGVLRVHGEYKVPGGKLVVVDLASVEGRLRDVRVSGDFFLEPDHALDVINGALVGRPADSSEAALADAIRDALGDAFGDGAALFGITPEGVAIAVHRALAGGEAA